MKRLTASIAILSILFTIGSVAAADKPMVRVSGQPCLHGMPTWEVLEEKLKDLPIDMKYMMFPSGAPQIEAMAANEWDVGAIGTVPMMMASIRYGALMIGISNDESETNDLWVRPDSPILKTKGANPKFPNLHGTAADWKGKKILCTTVSTGHFALSSTLKALGLKDNEVQIIQIEQGQAVAAFASGQGDILQMWAPFSYIAESRGWKKVSSGARAGAMIPGAIIVRKEYAEKNPEQVVQWLEIYMKMVAKMKGDHKWGTERLHKYFNDYCGMELSKELVAKEFELRPLFLPKEQVSLLTDPNKTKAWMMAIAQFFVDQGRINKEEMDRYVKNNCFIEPKFMEAVAAKWKN
ncbi:MAG TPA: ABC transporter substrate-binding protein [Desulfobacterales bacterium]|jgi:ABC-type nitrate/sulfonate/bicarbonate transport system substrate-binding protein|nr:ABC transporter substrate-binding protein [Desulfobacterales bacterium]